MEGFNVGSLYYENLKNIKDLNKYRSSGLAPDEVCDMAKCWKRFAKIFLYVDELGGSEVLERLVAVKRETKVKCVEKVLMETVEELYANRYKKEGITVE